jgi:hypothetical protein
MRHDKRMMLLAATLCAPGLFAQTQNDAEIACREAAVQYARTERLNVGTDLQSNRGGLYVVNWQVRDARNTYRGICEVDRNSRVQRIEQTQGPNLGGNTPAPPAAQGVPQVNVDTSGRGTFSFGGRGATRSQVDRAWVDTRGNRPSVSLNVDGRKITFYGVITERRTDREFDMQINDSSEGRATGTARFRLNGDRNEVEMVSVDGQLRGNRFDGTFQR